MSIKIRIVRVLKINVDVNTSLDLFNEEIESLTHKYEDIRVHFADSKTVSHYLFVPIDYIKGIKD